MFCLEFHNARWSIMALLYKLVHSILKQTYLLSPRTKPIPKLLIQSFVYESTYWHNLQTDCGYPGHPINGSVNTVNGTTFGQFVRYSCDIGFELEGIISSRCSANGIWTANAPTCKIKGKFRFLFLLYSGQQFIYSSVWSQHRVLNLWVTSEKWRT